MTESPLASATVEPPRLLRDLSSTEFADAYGCDRLTATILSNRLHYIIDHMCGQLLTNAFSPIIRDFYDFSAALVGPPDLKYRTPAVAKSLASFFGSMRDAVANAVEEFGPENLRPGDVLMCNDPYRGGTHVNDMCFMRPIFWDDRIVSVLTIRAHMMDMGGIVAGGFAGTKKNTYETGLVVPPTLLYRDDQPVRSAFSLIFDNARFGDLMVLDIQSILQSLLLGERLAHETIERYGVDEYRSTIRYACDVSAETMDRSLRSIPDGVYEGEDFVDCDAIDASLMYRVAVRVTKIGGGAEIDLGGTSQQARTCINGAWPDVKSAVAIALKLLVDPSSPYTSAVMRSIDIVAPPGTIVTALPPDGAVMLYWEALEPTIAALCRALNAALGDRAIAGAGRGLTLHNAVGRRPDGSQFSNVLNMNAGWGANHAGDGDSAQKAIHANFMDTPTEAVELTVPALIMRKEYVTDSGGPGRFRGGAGTALDSFWLAPTDSYVSSNHSRTAPGFGANGGCEGGGDATWAWPPTTVGDTSVAESPPPPVHIGLDEAVYKSSVPVSGRLDPVDFRPSVHGDFFHWGSKEVWSMPAGATWRTITAGGGGWGDPLTRDPAAVARDVRDGYVSVAGAARDYGVVVVGDPDGDPESVAADPSATAALRAAWTREACTAVPPPADHAVVATPVDASPRELVDIDCPACGRHDVRAYPVLAEDGWLLVEKCQACFHSLSRTPWRRLGYIQLIVDSL